MDPKGIAVQADVPAATAVAKTKCTGLIITFTRAALLTNMLRRTVMWAPVLEKFRVG